MRDWLQKVEDLKEVQHVKGANWELELGAITALWGADKRCLLFDDIPGYPKGFPSPYPLLKFFFPDRFDFCDAGRLQ